MKTKSRHKSDSRGLHGQKPYDGIYLNYLSQSLEQLNPQKSLGGKLIKGLRLTFEN